MECHFWEELRFVEYKKYIPVKIYIKNNKKHGIAPFFYFMVYYIMSHIYAFQIEKLKINFDNIITLKREIAKIKHLVVEKLAHLKEVYNDLIKSNNKKIFIFCLDSFYFQYKTFAMEMENIDRFRVLMNNRMYCDYYKLFNIILAYIKENHSELSKLMKNSSSNEESKLDINDLELKTFPVYKDLEPFLEYKIEDIKDIHHNILHLINKLYSQYTENDDQIGHYNENQKVGFSISNFLNTLNYENNLLKEQVSLFVSYISFFHISQKKQINRLYLRMQDFYKEIENNININHTFSIEDIGDEQRIERFFFVGEDVQIESILEDSDLLMENTDKMIEKLEVIVEKRDDNTNSSILEEVLDKNQEIVDIENSVSSEETI
jgi:hypothetical protein